MDMKKRKAIHIVIAYMYNIVFIIMSFVIMKHYSGELLITFIISGIVYLIYWIICSRKSYMPWCVYCHFLVGVVAQVLLNTIGVIPPDGGLFSGLGQFFYVVFVIALALIVGLVNLILFVIAKKKNKRAKEERI